MLPAPCFSVLPAYNPAIGQNQNDRDTLIIRYYHLGMDNVEILAYLSLIHGITLSYRHLKRILRQRGIRRRGQQSDENAIAEALEMELSGSGASIGYRQMHQRIRHNHKLLVSRENIRLALRAMDPDGVDRRRRHRLQRRLYRAKGPNFVWHLDGYDKLKYFGFCIHGAIDGYSRRIMWLEVDDSNKDPRSVARYFTECVKQIGGVPRKIRGDAGTENVNVAGVQRFLRRDDTDSFAGEKSFQYGQSVSNQRIECWWGFLRKTETDWWMNFFKNLREEGLFDDSDAVHVECLKFCFMNLLDQELKRVAQNWNLHKIRPSSSNLETPSGRPDTLFFLPALSETSDYILPFTDEDMNVAEELCCTERIPNENRVAFAELAHMIMEDLALQMPRNADEALALYVDLLQSIHDLSGDQIPE